MNKKYIVNLTEEERSFLLELTSKGKCKVRTLKRAYILLKANIGPGGPGLKDIEIKDAVNVDVTTVERIRKLFVEEGFDIALNGRPGEYRQLPKIDGEKEAHLITLACSEPPEGREKWNLRLLAKKMVELDIVDSISHETIRKALKKMNLNPGEKKCGVSHQKKMQNSSAVWKMS